LLQEAAEYPITPKEHGVEFLMDKRHLWLRSKRQWAIMRVRNAVIFAIHKYFQKNDKPAIRVVNHPEGESYRRESKGNKEHCVIVHHNLFMERS